MIAGLIMTAALAAGFGAPFAALGPGAAFASGMLLTVLAFFIATVFAGLGLGAAGWAVAALAAATFGLALWTRPLKPDAVWALHPVWWLSALVIAVGSIHGVPPYVAVNWDEMSAWAKWPLQMLAADAWWRPDMEMIPFLAAYTKGWPILAAGVTRLLGRDDLAVGIGVLTFWNISVLAAAYDLALVLFARRTALSANAIRIVAWVIVLILALGEATWKLVPHSYLVEQPEIYAETAFFILGGLASRGRSGTLAFVAAGLAMAAGYAVKTPLATLAVPALVFLAAVPGRRWRHACALFAPLAVVAVGWTLVRSHQTSIAHFSLADTLENGSLAQLYTVLALLARAFPAYLGLWKLPMTLLGVSGLIFALRSRDEGRILTLAIVLFTAFFFIGLVPLFLFVIPPFHGELPSFPRYVNVPLRAIHLLGCLLAMAELSRLVERWSPPAFLKSRHLAAAMIAGMVILMGALGWQVSSSMAAMADHPDFGRDDFAYVRAVTTKAAALKRIVAGMGGDVPNIVIIDQGGDGWAQIIAAYIGIRGPGPAATTDINAFHMIGPWSFGPKSLNSWMLPTDDDSFEAAMRKADMIWTYRLDPWARGQLARLAPDCATDLDGRLLVRDGSGHYRCRDFLD